jgi:hypothetical protein
MRGTILAASLAVLVGVSSVGCKSMPSLTWWKTADNSNANATAVARNAPALPSDVAIQTEGLAINTAPATGNTAAPYVATAAPYVATAAPVVTPTGYPNTGAPSFTSATAGVAQVVPAKDDSNLGTISLPYNPNGVPPAETVAAAPPVAAPTTPSRYATPPTPDYPPANTPAGNLPQFADASSRYGTQTAANTTPVYNLAPAPSAAPSYAPPTAQASVPPTDGGYGTTLINATGEIGDRYAQSATTALTQDPAEQPAAVPSYASTGQGQAIATSEPYRPGSTSTYPGATGTTSNYEVATRPEASTTTPGMSSSVPNVATPGNVTTPPLSAPQVPRYW